MRSKREKKFAQLATAVDRKRKSMRPEKSALCHWDELSRASLRCEMEKTFGLYISLPQWGLHGSSCPLSEQWTSHPLGSLGLYWSFHHRTWLINNPTIVRRRSEKPFSQFIGFRERGRHSTWCHTGATLIHPEAGWGEGGKPKNYGTRLRNQQSTARNRINVISWKSLRYKKKWNEIRQAKSRSSGSGLLTGGKNFLLDVEQLLTTFEERATSSFSDKNSARR